MCTPRSIYGIVYPDGTNFGAHVDGARTWTLAISIGNTASFFYETNLGRHFVIVRSGDVLIFNGGYFKHGVAEIYPDTAPAFWKTSLFNEKGNRFNIQFRDLSKTNSRYIPHFNREYDHQPGYEKHRCDVGGVGEKQNHSD
jgi:hypothetical protein